MKIWAAVIPAVLLATPVITCRADPIVLGARNEHTWPYERAASGVNYQYKDGRTFGVSVFYEQDGIFLKFSDEARNTQQIYFPFDEPDSDFDPKRSFITIAQYDFSSDGRDQLVVALNKVSMKDGPSGLRDMCVAVYVLKGNTWTLVPDRTKKESMCAFGVFGQPTLEMRANSFEIKRHFRDFFFKWKFEGGRFVSYGVY